MNTENNAKTAKRLFRVLDTLIDFELVICGYPSFHVFQKTTEVIRNTCKEKSFAFVTADVSQLSRFCDFEDFLRQASGKGPQYRVFNIVNVHHHVKFGKFSNFLYHLNLIRNRFASDFPSAFFFRIPANLVTRITLDAPDFWDWRNTALIFEDEEPRTNLPDLLIKTLDSSEFNDFTLKEKQRQIEHLREILPTLHTKSGVPKRNKKLGQAYLDLGQLLYLTGDDEAAFNYLQQSLNIMREIGNKIGTLTTLHNMALIAFKNNDIQTSLAYEQEAYQIALETQHAQGLYHAGMHLGGVLCQMGKEEEGRPMLKQSLEIGRKVGFPGVEEIAGLIKKYEK